MTEDIQTTHVWQERDIDQVYICTRCREIVDRHALIVLDMWVLQRKLTEACYGKDPTHSQARFLDWVAA